MHAEFDLIHNYYERPVYDEVLRVASMRGQSDQRLLADISCVALNRLPARYIRHEVDFAFYLTDEEREHNARAVRDAVAHAFEFVTKRSQKAA
jgi:hypothetical protein